MNRDDTRVGRPWGTTWDVFDPKPWQMAEAPVNRWVADIRTSLIGQGVSECRDEP